MPLEATMICIDNSEYQRNGDFIPSRWESQKDAVNLLLSVKTNENPENSVGIVKMAPKPEVLSSVTIDQGKLLTDIQNIKVQGNDNNFVRSLQVAHLALKHRQNRNQKMRIIAFVGSPVSASESELTSIAKRLKKNNISIDIIIFGGENSNNWELLTHFINQVKKADNSHLLTVPVSISTISDAIYGSEILNMTQQQQHQYQEFGGVNPEQEPELAMAIRISMEEAKAAQLQQGGESQGNQQDQQIQQQQAEEVKQALKLAQQKSDIEINITEEEALKRAMQLSMYPEENKQKYQEVFHDANFVENLLGGLQGVDKNDPIIQSALADLRGNNDNKEEEEQKQQLQQEEQGQNQQQSEKEQKSEENEKKKKKKKKKNNLV